MAAVEEDRNYKQHGELERLASILAESNREKQALRTALELALKQAAQSGSSSQAATQSGGSSQPAAAVRQQQVPRPLEYVYCPRESYMSPNSNANPSMRRLAAEAYLAVAMGSPNSLTDSEDSPESSPIPAPRPTQQSKLPSSDSPDGSGSADDAGASGSGADESGLGSSNGNKASGNGSSTGASARFLEKLSRSIGFDLF